MILGRRSVRDPMLSSLFFFLLLSSLSLSLSLSLSSPLLCTLLSFSMSSSQPPSSLLSSSMPQSRPMTSVPTIQLLSALIDAAQLGSSTIVSLSGEAVKKNVQYKEAGEARSAMTLADTAAQKVIVSSLFKTFPKLAVVGEEDETVEFDESVAVDLNLNLDLDFATGMYDDTMPEALDFNDICVYVDPLDGTREFVEGRLDNVQCLVGLCHRNTPLMGAVGIPFSTSEDQQTVVQVVYGLVGRGIGKLQVSSSSSSSGGETTLAKSNLPELKQYHDDRDSFVLSSGDSRSSLLMDSIAVIEGVVGQRLERRLEGACGNKILKVIHGDSTMSIMHDKTCLWDTCAPAALLTSVGGKVTDLFGEPLLYYHNNNTDNGGGSKELGNKLGVVVSAPGAAFIHDRVVRAMRGDSKVLSSCLKKINGNDAPMEAQCVDIVRDLDGYPLDKTFLGNVLGINIDSYECPEREAVRGIMSNGCRLHLHGGSDGGDDGKESKVTSAFYKRIVFGHLDHARDKLKTAPHKLLRDVKSYRVETSFLASMACQKVIEGTGLRIPKCFHSELRPDEDHPIESRFSVLLEDFSPKDGWSQRWLLHAKSDCHAVLTAFAKMHAFFWSGSNFWKNEKAAGEELIQSVWESASYVQPTLQTLNQCQQVNAGWMKHREKCRDELQGMDYWETLGSRLESVAEQVGHDAHPFAPPQDHNSVQQQQQHSRHEKFKTLIHGDPKQTNIFFQQVDKDDDDDDDSPQVGLIDFQWCGFGLAASDIAHHISAAVHADMLEAGGELELLEYYYTNLAKYLIDYGAYSTREELSQQYSFEMFLEQYETALLDMCRLVIAYAWSRFERVTDESEYSRTANKNSYNKSVPNVVWFMNRCDEILTKRGI